jgi:uncharacterized protein YbjT (DUF2867 family)
VILVVGATSGLGADICRRLRERRMPVRALVREGTATGKAERLRQMGVELCVGDLTHMMSVAAACQDADAVINAASCVLCPKATDSIESVERQGGITLVEFARKLGVRRFVYVTLPRTLRTHCPLLRARAEVEDRVAHSGMTFTILCTNYFMDSWLNPTLGFDYANARVKLFGGGRAPIGWVACSDVAEIASRVVDSEGARNRILDVAGPENVSPNEVVRIFEEVSGNRFEVEHVPEQAIEAEYNAATDPISRSIAALKLEYARGCAMDPSETLRIVPIKPTSVRDYANQVAAPQTATV